MVMTTTSKVWDEGIHHSVLAMRGAHPVFQVRQPRHATSCSTATQPPSALGKKQALASSLLCGGCPEGQGVEGAESKGTSLASPGVLTPARYHTGTFVPRMSTGMYISLSADGPPLTVQRADLGYFDYSRLIGTSEAFILFSFVWRQGLTMFPRLAPNSWAQVILFL